MRCQPKNVLTSTDGGNVFSIYVQHDEDEIWKDDIFMDVQTWQTVFKPIYDSVAYYNCTSFENLNLHFFKDCKSELVGKREVNLMIDMHEVVGKIDKFDVEENLKIRLPKEGIQFIVDCAHHISEMVASYGNKYDKQDIEKWMSVAKVNYDRDQTSKLFGVNKSLSKMVQSVHQKRHLKLSS